VIVTDRGEDIESHALLVAVGRRPAVEGLALKPAGVKISDRGNEVDGHLQTTQKHIYACGDLIGRHQFTQYAGCRPPPR
jgi:pyruvate/2-oxoglutarate dehydrogenase complex dihydrolipoamide dehydrogenase (E3) component